MYIFPLFFPLFSQPLPPIYSLHGLFFVVTLFSFLPSVPCPSYCPANYNSLYCLVITYGNSVIYQPLTPNQVSHGRQKRPS